MNSIKKIILGMLATAMLLSYIPIHENLMVKAEDPISTQQLEDPEVPTGLQAVKGSKLSSVELPPGWHWDDDERSVGDTLGDQSFTAYFNGEGYNNVNNQIVTLNVVEYLSENKMITTGGTTTSDLNFKIQATHIKVVVPLSVDFVLDPTVDLEGSIPAEKSVTNVQVSGANDIKITNKSLVPIWVRVSSVATDNATSGVTLVNSTSDLSTDKAIMFGLKSLVRADGNTQADWLPSGTVTENYFINDGYTGDEADKNGKLAAFDSSDGNQADNSVAINVMAMTKKGWKTGDAFKITPQFTFTTTVPTNN